jgi:hypothetical protein
MPTVVLIIVCVLVAVIAVFSVLQLSQNPIMQLLARFGPMVSFVFCLLGGAVLLLNGMDRADYVWSGMGFFFIGIAFFVGPMLWLSAKK